MQFVYFNRSSAADANAHLWFTIEHGFENDSWYFYYAFNWFLILLLLWFKNIFHVHIWRSHRSKWYSIRENKRTTYYENQLKRDIIQIHRDHRDLVADNDKIRYIFGLKRNDHVTEYRQRLNELTPESRAKLHSAVMIFKQLKIQSPVYLNLMFVRNGESYRYPDNLRVNFNSRTAFDDRAFSYSAINFWNNIPVGIRKSESLASFKLNLKHFLSAEQ